MEILYVTTTPLLLFFAIFRGKFKGRAYEAIIVINIDITLIYKLLIFGSSITSSKFEL